MWLRRRRKVEKKPNKKQQTKEECGGGSGRVKEGRMEKKNEDAKIQDK